MTVIFFTGLKITRVLQIHGYESLLDLCTVTWGPSVCPISSPTNLPGLTLLAQCSLPLRDTTTYMINLHNSFTLVTSSSETFLDQSRTFLFLLERHKSIFVILLDLSFLLISLFFTL